MYIYIHIFVSFVSLYLYVPDEGSLLPKYRDCTTSNDFELYLMCDASVNLLYTYIYTYYLYIYISYMYILYIYSTK